MSWVIGFAIAVAWRGAWHRWKDWRWHRWAARLTDEQMLRIAEYDPGEGGASLSGGRAVIGTIDPHRN